MLDIQSVAFRIMESRSAKTHTTLATNRIFRSGTTLTGHVIATLNKAINAQYIEMTTSILSPKYSVLAPQLHLMNQQPVQ